jgi:hypothetical protein
MLEQEYLTFDEIPDAFMFDQSFAAQSRFIDVSALEPIEETEQVVGVASGQNAANPGKWWAKSSQAKKLIRRKRRVFDQVKGNNTTGRAGKLKCTECRKIRSKVFFPLPVRLTV